MNKIRILFSLLLLLALPSLAVAQTSAWGMPGPDDKSVVFLGYIFGVVNGVLHGAGSQIMGAMFAKFNSAVLALAGVVVFYTTIIGLLHSAQDGEFLGKKYHSFFVPMRTALGILLIAPTATGYSWIQVIIMWIVLQGVGAANMVWNAALTYLMAGGTIITQNQSLTNGPAQNVRTSVSQLMPAITCLTLMQHGIDQVAYTKNAQASGITPPTTSALATVESAVATASTATPDGQNWVNIPIPNFNATTDASWVPLNGKCGSLSLHPADSIAVNQVIGDLSAAAPNITDTCNAGCYHTNAKPYNPQISEPNSYYCNDGSYLSNAAANCSSAGTCSMFGLAGTPTGSLATLLTNAKTGGAGGTGTGLPVYSWCTGINWTVPNLPYTFNTAVMDFMGLTYTRANPEHTDQLPTPGASSWFTAGTFYFALVAQNEAAQQDSNSHTNFKVQTPDGSGILTVPYPLSLAAPLTSSEEVFGNWLQPFLAASGNNNLIKTFGQPVDPPAAGALAQGQITQQDYGHKTPSNFSPTDTDGNGLVFKILDALLPGIFQMVVAFAGLVNAQATNSNPVILMMMFGSGMISTSISSWFTASLIAAGLAGAIGMIPCVTISSGITAFMSAFTSFLNAILLPMFVTGCMLLYYLPAVPFMIFTFGTIGWIIGVIEAMVAAPIVGFGIMSPDGGSDMFGKGEMGVMLMLNVFLRPSLMIFGLITGIMISYIGIWLINDGYTSILPTVVSVAFGGSSEIAIVINIIVGAIMMPMIYMIICLQVINRSFTLIYILPDKVTRWIQGGQQEALGQEMAGVEKDAKTSTQAGTQHVGEGTSSAGLSYKQAGGKGGRGDKFG